MKITIKQVSEFFDLFDIPDIFFRERVESQFFTDMLNEFVQTDNSIDDNKIFLLMHLSNRQFVYLNFYNILITIMMKDSKYRKYRNRVVAGFLALLYTSWDFHWNENRENILSGKERFFEFFSDEFYKNLPGEEQFVKRWIDDAIPKNKVLYYLDALADNIDQQTTTEIDEVDQIIVKILKDCITLSPIYIYYCMNTESDEELQKTHIFNLLMIFFTQYGIQDLSKIINNLQEYCLNHQPVSEFTKTLIAELGLQNNQPLFNETELQKIQDIHRNLIEDFQEQNSLVVQREFDSQQSCIY